jgi:hypothetical protein
LTYLVANLRPSLQGLGGAFLRPLVRPKVAHRISARPRALLCLRRLMGRLHPLFSQRRRPARTPQMELQLPLATRVALSIINVDGLDVGTNCGRVCRHRGPGPLPLLLLRPVAWVAAGRRISSPPSAAYTVALRPWMEPYAMWREPRRHSPPSSRRRTR